MTILIHENPPKLKNTIFVAAWAGWPDAARVATRAIREIITQTGAKKFASIDPEEFYDFSQNRPTVKNGIDGKREIKWPANDFYYVKTSNGLRDLVLFIGVEPNYKWKTYVDLVFETAKSVNTELFLTLGALLDSVPHTRAPRVTGNTTSSELADLFGVNYGLPSYEGPSGLTSVLGSKFEEANITCASIWGHAPHYLQIAHNPTLTHAVLNELKQFIKVELDLQQLEGESDEFRSNLEHALEDQKEIEGYVRKLEERFDSEEKFKGTPEPAELVKDLEDYLKQQRESGGL